MIFNNNSTRGHTGSLLVYTIGHVTVENTLHDYIREGSLLIKTKNTFSNTGVNDSIDKLKGRLHRTSETILYETMKWSTDDFLQFGPQITQISTITGK